jgi:hypothetical protein
MKLDDIGNAVLTALQSALNLIVFVLASVLFLPALLIVNLLQDWWSKKLGSLFDL